MYVVTPPQRSGFGSDCDLRVYQTWKGSNVSFNVKALGFGITCFCVYTWASFLLFFLLLCIN